ncbi:TetR/AcrR family transcriptional regulator [Peterkaempfera bronchialis]|uniref:TetR/AcrR family transcriptional regulator n=1 Tax=Peterkaempfera bronchialis TaxID=2126346 RepID=A0A345T6H2_9ACTN|nr:TetR/AcrR family transcriptional regulator [Peterkaempfera bronchialis]
MAAHREMQRTALLAAARALLVEGGVDALTFPALASRTGLARSSVYEYFGSRGAVVEELFAADFPVWSARIETAMAEAATPEARVEAYVRTQLALAGDPRHRAVTAISAAELDDDARDRIRAAHGRLVELVVSALRELGHEQPGLAAGLLQGLVESAARRQELGAAEDPEVIADAAVELALHGVAAGAPGRGHAAGAACCTWDGSSRTRPRPSNASGSR